MPLLAREQSLVVAGLEAIGQRLPFPIRGIDSDNDGVFINETMIQYCTDHGIEFTRSRSYRSNDQAWIEQKNGSVVRRFVGHDRYSGQVAGQAMAHLYEALRLHVNFFQPSFKLIDKTRDGATTVKHYSQPSTPCDRLIQHDETSDEMRATLNEYRARLDPVLLLHTIREAQSWPRRHLRKCVKRHRVKASVGSSPSYLGPVHANGAEMLSCPHGDYRSSVRTHCTGPSRSARQRQTVELASAQRDSVCRRTGLPVAGVAAPIRQLAYRLHTDEPLVEEWGARPGV